MGAKSTKKVYIGMGVVVEGVAGMVSGGGVGEGVLVAGMGVGEEVREQSGGSGKGEAGAEG